MQAGEALPEPHDTRQQYSAQDADPEKAKKEKTGQLKQTPNKGRGHDKAWRVHTVTEKRTAWGTPTSQSPDHHTNGDKQGPETPDKKVGKGGTTKVCH